MRRDSLYKAILLEFDLISALSNPPTESQTESPSLDFTFHPIDFAASIRIPKDSAVIESHCRELSDQLERSQRDQSNSLDSVRAERAECEAKIAELSARRESLRRELKQIESQLTAVSSRLQTVETEETSLLEASQRAIDALQAELRVFF